MSVRFSIGTPTERRGAIGSVVLTAATNDELDAALLRVAGRGVPVGSVALRDLAGVDRGVVARWSGTSAELMPHGGTLVMRRLVEALEKLGVEQEEEPGPRSVYPEACDEIEARMLAALARAPSPLAVELLLDQPRRWRAIGRDPGEGELAPGVLSRLIDPALVVAIGRANIGKSTLVNALAGRGVSVVAPEPGTTRDHVGVLLDLGGLVVRFVDTPGVRDGAGDVEREASALAQEIAARADLVLSCGDAASPALACEGEHLRVALRSDLGGAQWDHDASVSAETGEGLGGLVSLVRDTLVPPDAIRDPRAWRFWDRQEP